MRSEVLELELHYLVPYLGISLSCDAIVKAVRECGERVENEELQEDEGVV